jgi:hypothetical protein
MQRRKTTPRVKDGRVQKKHRSEITAPDGYTQGCELQIIRHAPGPGRVHVVDEHDVRRFLELLPDWPRLGRGIRAIVLDRDREDFDGCYRHDGVIVLTSWPCEIVQELDLDYHEQHQAVFERIGVASDIVAPEPREPSPAELDAAAGGMAPLPAPPEPFARCWFEPDTARDYMLMHVFLHELGHHHDWRTLRPNATQNRGEDYAEAWALEREQQLWPRYRAIFARR